MEKDKANRIVNVDTGPQASGALSSSSQATDRQQGVERQRSQISPEQSVGEEARSDLDRRKASAEAADAAQSVPQQFENLKVPCNLTMEGLHGEYQSCVAGCQAHIQNSAS